MLDQQSTYNIDFVQNICHYSGSGYNNALSKSILQHATVLFKIPNHNMLKQKKSNIKVLCDNLNKKVNIYFVQSNL